MYRLKKLCEFIKTDEIELKNGSVIWRIEGVCNLQL